METHQYTFLRHGKLDLPYRDHAEMPFSIFADLGTDVLSPSIDESYAKERIKHLKGALQLQMNAVLASPSRRCQETAAILRRAAAGIGGEVIPRTSVLLSEVEFDLRSLNADDNVEAALAAHDIAAVNEAVFKGMISGEHCEPVERVYARVAQLFEELRDLQKPCICITHDFYMRVVELYIRRHGDKFRTITLNDLVSTRRNRYLSGFATNSELVSFLPIELA